MKFALIVATVVALYSLTYPKAREEDIARQREFLREAQLRDEVDVDRGSAVPQKSPSA
jgi:hypothetical protein